MDLKTLVECLIRLKTAEAFLDAPRRRLAITDLTAEGFAAYNSLLDAHGLISAVLLDLTDVVRNRHPLAIREMGR